MVEHRLPKARAAGSNPVSCFTKSQCLLGLSFFMLYFVLHLHQKYFMRRHVVGMINFSPLWKTMEEKNISQYSLLKSGIDNKTLDSLKKNKNITILTLEKLCKILDCLPNDIVRFDFEIEYPAPR